MGSNGLCVADKSTDELLHDFQNGGAQASPFAKNGEWGPQAAYEEIVRRYAGMVYSVCLQVTRDVHDAEDATQAAFLTLALRAKTAQTIKYLGPWLQKISRRLSLDIMRAKKRRKRREERRGEMARQLQPDRDPSNGLDRAEMADIVRDELNKLPSKYRLPLILHYFGGLRPEEVARELGYKPSTLGVRLHRGRKMLADSLAERGITISNGMLASVLALVVHEGISDNVIAQTSLAAAGITHNGELPGAIISSRVIGLTRHAASALIWAKAKAVVAATLMATVALAGGVQVVRTIAPASWDLQRFNPLNWIRPLFRSLVVPPQFSAVAEPIVSEPIPSPSGMNALPSIDWLRQAMSGPAENNSVSFAFTRHSSEVAPWSWTSSDISESDPVFGVSSGSASMSLAQAGVLVAPGTLPLSVQSPIAIPNGSATVSSGFVLDESTRSIAHMAGTRRMDRLVLDSSLGAAQTYILGGSARLDTKSLVIGDVARGAFQQSGGNVNVASDLILGRLPGSFGSYQLDGSSQLNSANLYIGYRGTGHMRQSGGVNRAKTVNIAQHLGSKGTLDIGGGVLSAGQINVGVSGSGEVHQNGGDVVALARNDGSSGDVRVGINPDGDGSFLMNGGTLRAESLVIGDAGRGSFLQDAGNLYAGSVSVGDQPTGIGQVLFRGGDLAVASAGSVIVGNKGTATMILGGRRGMFSISEQQPDGGAGLLVRANSAGRGELHGNGEVKLTGPLVQNGRLIADGFNQSRELDLSSASYVTNTIDNSAEGGTNGWYAQRGGKLVLPPIKIPSDRTATWGEDPHDPIPDLVNSVRFSVRDVEHPGRAVLSLLADDYVHVPTLPRGEQFVGIWSFDRKDMLEFESADLLIRYDDGMIRRVHGDESELRLWTYTDGWQVVPADSLGGEPSLNLLYGRVGGDFRLFGISLGIDPIVTTPLPTGIPEPASLLLAVAASGLLLRRMRR